VTREEFMDLMGKIEPTASYRGALGYRYTIQRCDDQDAWEVAIGTQIIPFVSEFIPSSQFQTLTESEASEIIQRTLNRIVTLRAQIHEFIKERLEQ